MVGAVDAHGPPSEVPATCPAPKIAPGCGPSRGPERSEGGGEAASTFAVIVASRSTFSSVKPNKGLALVP
eukprot:2543406-Alexandrium_andersonii.AAC.1